MEMEGGRKGKVEEEREREREGWLGVNGGVRGETRDLGGKVEFQITRGQIYLTGETSAALCILWSPAGG